MRLPDADVRIPVNLQDWLDLTFLHWSYPPHQVQRLLPDGLRVQEWEGVTWVGVIPFTMANVRMPYLPVIPRWKSFAELNVRAYVTGPDGREGIFFQGMLVDRLSFALALRSIGLPYSQSDSVVQRTGTLIDYRFGAPGPIGPHDDQWFTGSVHFGQPIREEDRSPLIDTLTGRWTVFHRRGILWRTPVNHAVWPLHQATITGDLTAPLRWVGLPEPTEPPLVQASPGVSARFGSLRPA